MRSFWPMDQMKVPDPETMLLAREVADLLHRQERLLDAPMNANDMTVYEVRSQQIRELIAKLG